ncbi:MAG TPA: R3H domain-containing nucleic acid-binding protein [Anaerolineales bacterium]|nr:R3H domain-containing nucleic acid-binding protein [Anaerolineales bacterium]
MTQQKITDDLGALLDVLPKKITESVKKLNHSENLLEIIIDLGRLPTARFTTGEVLLREEDEVTHDEINQTVEGVGEFDEDNRAGIERTLHRISAIRNRRGAIVGLTCRVGRAVYGTIDIIQDIIESGKSVLLLGRPGVGKTTLLREAARILAAQKRVVIVDTSNEIGGDGDVPHPAVGRARRMQVSTPSLQHEVMIEAVENHNPEVIVIDEIGRELEALAARTIAERGVQLVGTAHGNTLENLLVNPTLSDLVGGIESVTLSDEEARRRGTQKTVLERRAPPTFDVLIEIQTRDRLAIHHDVSDAVDSLLRGNPIPAEIRSRDAEGKIHIEQAPSAPRTAARDPQGLRRPTPTPSSYEPADDGPSTFAERYEAPKETANRRNNLTTVRVYPYGVARNRLAQAAKKLGVPVLIGRDVGEADVLVTLRSYYRKRQHAIVDAEHRGMPIYVLRANTINQMEQFLAELFNITNNNGGESENEEGVMNATRAAIDAVLNGENWVELPPASAYIRRQQHELARQARLVSHSYGKEPYRRVRIFREQSR